MIIHFTETVSEEIKRKMGFLIDSRAAMELYFSNKEYGSDLKVLYIGLIYVHPRFAEFFKSRRPKYVPEEKRAIEHGIEVVHDAKSLSYDLQLDYANYLAADNTKLLLANDVLSSLNTISTVKKIKDFDVAKFRDDFEQFFKAEGWLS